MYGKLVSIIVPVYNVKDYLEKCINSICNQTYSNLEIILIDDGSTDESGKICDKLSEEDSRIKVIHQENGGLADARNVGIDICTGDYISFVDSDDWIDMHMIETLVDACEKHLAQLACCGRYLYYNERYIKTAYANGLVEKWNVETAISNLLSWNQIDSAAWDKLYDKSLFDGIRFPKGRLHEDIFIMYKIFEKANAIIHIGTPLYYYRQRDDGITRSRYKASKMDLFDAICEVEDHINHTFPELKMYMDAFAITNINIIIYLLRQDKRNLQIYKEDYEKLLTAIKQHSNGWYRNPYLKRQEKIKLCFTKLHLSNLYIALKNMYINSKHM